MFSYTKFKILKISHKKEEQTNDIKNYSHKNSYNPYTQQSFNFSRENAKKLKIDVIF